MLSSNFTGVPLSLIAVAALSGLVGCADTPTEMAIGAARAPVAYAQVDGQKAGKKAAQLIARVRADGTLVDGTAVTAERTSLGLYLVTFPQPIEECAAAANSAFFPGADIAVFRVVAHLRIGTAAGPETVAVSLFQPGDGTNTDSAFTLLLVCP